jgi:hypothetical protein
VDVNEHIRLRLVHEIHTSERKSFRACRRRWDWIFNDRYYPLVTAKPLEFGTAFHAAMEKYYDPDTWAWDREVVGALAIETFVKECEAQRKMALEQRGDTYLEEDVQADYDERVELGKGMLKYYVKDVAPKLDKGWKPVQVEIEFMLPIPNPETGDAVMWCRCWQCWERYYVWYGKQPLEDRNKIGSPDGAFNTHTPPSWFKGLPIVYAGRIDMLAQAADGSLWIFDWKTARTVSEKYEFLYLDDQVASYVWALRKLGLNVRGFIYHEQKKAFPQAPVKNKVRRLGRIFSVSKTQDTDYQSYLEAIKEEDAEAYEGGLYDEYLTYLEEQGILFYMRHQIYKSDAEIQETERNIGYEALDMTDPNLRIYPSPGRFGCNFCAFQEPCKEKNAQGDYLYVLNSLYVRREHYYLREKPSTESQSA